MTPRGEISWVDAEQSEDEIRRQLLSSPHSLFPVCRGELDEIIGIVRAKEMLVAPSRGKRRGAGFCLPAIVVPETLDPINLLGVLRRARGSFVIVTNEFGVVQGWSRRWTSLKPSPVNSRTLMRRQRLSSMAMAGLLRGRPTCMRCSRRWGWIH